MMKMVGDAVEVKKRFCYVPDVVVTLLDMDLLTRKP